MISSQASCSDRTLGITYDCETYVLLHIWQYVSALSSLMRETQAELTLNLTAIVICHKSLGRLYLLIYSGVSKDVCVNLCPFFWRNWAGINRQNGAGCQILVFFYNFSYVKCYLDGGVCSFITYIYSWNSNTAWGTS